MSNIETIARVAMFHAALKYSNASSIVPSIAPSLRLKVIIGLENVAVLDGARSDGIGVRKVAGKAT